MVLIIISVILVILTAIYLSINLVEKEVEEKDYWGSTKKVKKQVVEFKIKSKVLLSLLWLLLILFGCFTRIGANTVGIVYDPFNGGIQSKTLKEGYKGKSPLTKVYKISTKVVELNFKDLNVQSQDSQWLNTQLQVQARIDKTKAFDYFKKYSDKDLKDISTIISNTIKKELESITIKYNITDILGSKRDDIVNETLSLVQKELIKDGILIERIVLIDTDAGESIEQAISNEAVAKKEVDTAEYKKQKAELEGEAKVIEAKKEKEANELISNTLTDEILLEKFIEKWNGELPKVTGGENILDISSFIK